MKNKWVWVGIVIVVLLIVGYMGRHKIKEMLGMSSAQPAVQTSNNYAASSNQPQATTSSATATSDNIYLTKSDSTKGPYLTDFDGKTLYIYDKDTSGVSNCADKCAVAWPPYASGAATESTLPTNITIISRADGTKQFAWKGMPLYYYEKDMKAGDITGDGVGGVWHLVKP